MSTTAASPVSVRALFDLPTEVHKGEFVLMLSEGIEHPEKTAADYVVTPALADVFDRALGSVGGAIADGRSRAAYLHGSFGSGKSHFMALLSLLLDGHEAAWKIPELHALRAKHAFVGSRKLLKLHFHMLGHASIEHAIYSGYLEYCRRHHPDVPIPAVFADEQLFADARNMLEELGNEAFFGPMNGGAAPVSGWGNYAAEALWNRERFEQFASSTNPKERAELFNALARTRFRAYATESRAFIDLDSGLAVIARHASELGYDAIVLFLDELILWLSHKASEVAWLHNEVQKMVKLVEAQDAARQIPIVSFIARQRSLVEMVGKEYAGAESVRLNDSLKHWEGRYDTLLLEDRNLPLIVEKRLLRPRDAQAKNTLDQSFGVQAIQNGSSLRRPPETRAADIKIALNQAAARQELRSRNRRGLGGSLKGQFGRRDRMASLRVWSWRLTL